MEVYEQRIDSLASENERYKQSYNLVRIYEEMNNDLRVKMKIMEHEIEASNKRYVRPEAANRPRPRCSSRPRTKPPPKSPRSPPRPSSSGPKPSAASSTTARSSSPSSTA